MVCGCPNCGTLMVQAERGLFSSCVCPACGTQCDACMGTNRQIPMDGPIPDYLEQEYDNPSLPEDPD